MTIVRPAGTGPVKVCGTSYPDAAEIPGGLSPSTQAPLSLYAVPAEQACVSTAAPRRTTDYFPSAGYKVVSVAEKMYAVEYGHRTSLVHEAT
ncbi:hypothetical protein [Streptomyces sp. NPDC093984]|uniref:hypothetical protein n=1 Tax=Streptomyces sp. NPDC093984 TaxID=3366052 RepID=UPI00382248BB